MTDSKQRQRQYLVSCFFTQNREVEVSFNIYAISMMFAVVEWHRRCRECELDPMSCNQLTFREIA